MLKKWLQAVRGCRVPIKACCGTCGRCRYHKRGVA
jgi:hypothetical protein